MAEIRAATIVFRLLSESRVWHFIDHGPLQRKLDDLPVHITSMTDLVYGHDRFLIIDEIHDAIAALADAISIIESSKLLRSMRPWIVG